MSTMNITCCFADEIFNTEEVKPFSLFRDHILPALEQRRPDFESMYAAVMGRPELDPVFLAGVTLLQMMERLPDRATITALATHCVSTGTLMARPRTRLGKISGTSVQKTGPMQAAKKAI